MAKRLDEKFIRSVIKNVEDCATPLQLRVYLSKYEDYVFSEAIKKVFQERIEFFKDWFAYNTLEMGALEDCEDMLEVNVMISNSRQKLFNPDHRDNHKKEARAYLSDSKRGAKKLSRK